MDEEKKSVNSNNGDLAEIFRALPKRKLSEMEREVILILIEKSKIQREQSMTILNKGFLIFVAFIILAYLSRLTNFLSESYISILFIFGIIILIISMMTYQSAINKEKKILDSLLDSFLK